jgi:hypothetical protein
LTWAGARTRRPDARASDGETSRSRRNYRGVRELTRGVLNILLAMGSRGMKRKGQHLPKVGRTPRRSLPNLPGYYLREPVEREQELMSRPTGARWLGFVVTYLSMRRRRRRPKPN